MGAVLKAVGAVRAKAWEGREEGAVRVELAAKLLRASIKTKRQVLPLPSTTPDCLVCLTPSLLPRPSGAVLTAFGGRASVLGCGARCSQGGCALCSPAQLEADLAGGRQRGAGAGAGAVQGMAQLGAGQQDLHCGAACAGGRGQDALYPPSCRQLPVSPLPCLPFQVLPPR